MLKVRHTTHVSIVCVLNYSVQSCRSTNTFQLLTNKPVFFCRPDGRCFDFPSQISVFCLGILTLSWNNPRSSFHLESVKLKYTRNCLKLFLFGLFGYELMYRQRAEVETQTGTIGKKAGIFRAANVDNSDHDCWFYTASRTERARRTLLFPGEPGMIRELFKVR